ncbi:MAG: DNA pilot protein [Arizlama microvirus]|nr:MAG: DNA pilot protein [Arizlama microvirus]
MMAISGGLSALSNLGGGMMSAGGAAAQNAQQQAQFQQQVRIQQEQFERSNSLHQWEYANSQAFQERMANSAYQRAMYDMRSAGLNPILAYQQGGASAPSGSSPAAAGHGSGAPSAQAGVNAGAEMGRGVARAVSSGLDAAQTVQTLDNMKAQKGQIEANTNLMGSQQRLADADAIQKAAQTKLTEGQEKQLQFAKDKIIAETNSAYSQSGYYGSAARNQDEQANRTRIAADKERTYGYGTPADLGDSAEKLSSRITQQLRTTDPISKTFRPFTGLRNQ